MGFFVFLLFVIVILLWAEISGLKTKVERLNEQFIVAKDELATMTARLLRLEHGRPAPPPMPPAVVVSEPAAPASPMPGPEVPLAPTPAPPRAPVPMPTPKAAPTPLPAVAPLPMPTPVPSPLPLRNPEPAPSVAAAVAEPAAKEPTESWEMVVGTSWLNKIGVLVFVVGVALLVAYSFAHIGPAGRVAVGYVLSLGMLAGGVMLEKRPPFRNYAYGLVAGGWAGTYFTTFAMHDVPAARIIENDVLAITLLSSVAAGMIAHSLRYRSQVVTALAFIVAYTTLALSPLSGFSLAASVPLAVSVLVVSQRLAWPGVSALGIAATYGAFVLRGNLFPGGVMDPSSTLPYVTLATYWLAFEAADIIGLRLRVNAGQSSRLPAASMLALNAVGFMGASLVTIPRDNPHLLSVFLFSSATGYVVSAAIRAWWLPATRPADETDQPFDSSHGATAMASVLFAFAIGQRFSGNRAILARLLEAQLLITAGLTFGDVWLRRFGSIGLALAAGFAVMHAGTVGAGMPVLNSEWAPGTTSAVFGLIALAAYGDREALSRRKATLVWLEPGFTWIATALLATVFVLEFTPAHQALAGLVLAVALLEIGFRRSSEYVAQAYLLGIGASYALMAAFLLSPDGNGLLGAWGVGPTSLDEWTVLPGCVALAAFAAWRLLSRPDDERVPGRLMAAAAAATLATLFLVVFEWRVLVPNAIAPAWALTAVGLVALGLWKRQSTLRWQGYAVAVAATVRAVEPLLNRLPDSRTETTAILVVIAAVYAVAYLGRRGMANVSAPTLEAGDSAEGAAVTALSMIATASFVLWKWRVLPELMIAPAWALTGLVLVALGSYRARPGQRWQGYALSAIGAVRVMGLLRDTPSATTEASLWAIGVIALVYGTSWIARRPDPAVQDPVVPQALPVLGTAALALLQWRIFEDPLLGPVWTATGVALLALGLWRRGADFRWQAYALLALGAVRAGRPVFSVPDATTDAVWWLLTVIAALYGCGLVVRRISRGAGDDVSVQAEDAIGASALLGATALLAALIVDELRPSLVTLALGLQGLALMFAGLVSRERVMRLSGLALLLACILKLFIYDLRELEALSRIMSFVVLGVFLLAISWTYTRYREQIRKFL